jgi:hypothetical protein
VYLSKTFQNSSVRKICLQYPKAAIQRRILFLMLPLRNLLCQRPLSDELLCYIFNCQLKYSRRTQGIDRVEGRFSADGLAKRYVLYKYFRVSNGNTRSARRKSWNFKILRVRYSQQRKMILSKLRWAVCYRGFRKSARGPPRGLAKTH